MPIDTNSRHNPFSDSQQFVLDEQHSDFANEFTNKLLADAIRARASDLHFEPRRKGIIVRARMDGLLQTVCQLSNVVSAATLSHLKLRAELDIAEKRLPQDGRFRFSHNNVDFICRISTLPTLHGEKIVTRLLAINSQQILLDELGLNQQQLQLLAKGIEQPQGLILITGPTGSGKTTTLYAILSALNSSKRNITSLENPIEIELAGINQVNINDKIGLSFDAVLPAVLRQDPDIIMVGEIRKLTTARLVLQAAQTGHLVLATLHTNSSFEALSRLRLMGLSAIDLAETLQLIVAQRLLRKICPCCKNKKKSTCSQCATGYQGRIGIFEMLSIDQTLQKALFNQDSLVSAKHTDFFTLWQAGLEKLKQGITDEQELHRVVGEQR